MQVDRAFGGRGTRALDAAFSACFQHYNPTLQVLYVTLLLVGYYLYCREVFALLPQPYAPLWHQCAPAPAHSALCFLIIAMMYHGSLSTKGHVLFHTMVASSWC